MRILALDLGTRCGWAYLDGAHRESGVQVFDVKRGESPGMRYLRFNGWLATWDPASPHGVKVRLDLVIYEQTLARAAASFAQSEIATGFATRAQEFCARHTIEHTAVWPSALKKWLTGKGNAKKEDMLRAARLKLNLGGIVDDNEVDAIALLAYAQEMWKA